MLSKKRIATVAALGLAASLLTPALMAQAAASDSLNVGFNGSLVGTTAYTTAGTEQMHGVLKRINGSEEQIAQQGVKLTGGTQGLRYDAADIDLGPDTASNGFIGEVKFTPTASANLSTIASAGGNFFLRAQGTKLRYGFDSLSGSTWSSNYKEVDFPTLNAAHALSFHYLPTAQGVTLTVHLDGTALPAVTSTLPAKNAAGLSNAFVFGNEVNTQGNTRGMTGTLHEVRIAKAAAAWTQADFEFQPKPQANALLDATFDGAMAAGAYTPAAAEKVDGTLRGRAGSETVTGGKATLTGGTQAIDFASASANLGTTSLSAGFVAEAVFTPTTGQVAQGTLIGVGGNFFARYNAAGSSFEYGYSTNASGSWVDFKTSSPLPAADAAHTFSIAYIPATDGKVKVVAALDGKELASIDGTGLSTKSGAVATTAGFGNDVNPGASNRGFKGSLDKTRFALLAPEVTASTFDLKTFTYQDVQPTQPETCEPLMVDPANYIQVSAGDCTENILAKAAAVRPTKQQLEWQELQQTAFVHFGINTFYNQEWGHGTEDPARFNPTNFDADSWVKNLRDNGFRMAILTVKHHDGFMSYPSRYTDYTVASSPWKNGKGDVVKEFTAAAHKYGMKVGLYMSPADSNQEVDGVFGNGSAKSLRTIPTLVAGDDRAGKDLPQFQYQATDYGAFFLNTLYEILTEYGQVDEVWFDGAQGNTAKQEVYDYPAFYNMIGKLQPNAVVAVGGRDVRWIGNEQGTARQNEWNVIPVAVPNDGGKISAVNGEESNLLGSSSTLVQAVKNGSANNLHWWPGEADMKLTGGWFAHPNDVPKNGTTMLGKYHDSVGRNSVLLLNVPPTTTGQFAPSSITALQEFTAERAKAFTQDHALGMPASIKGSTTPALTDGNLRTSQPNGLGVDDSFTIDLGSAKAVDRIALAEDTFNHGQVVESLTVEALVGQQWTKVADIGSVGVQRITKFASTVTASQFRVTVKGTRGPAYFSNVQLFQTLATAPAQASELFVDCTAPLAGTGTQASPLNSLEQFRQRDLAPGTTIRFKAGTNCAGSDAPYWGYGTAAQPLTVNSYGSGAAPTVAGASLQATFGKFASQGWVVDAPVPATITADAGSVEAGKSVKVSLAGFVPGAAVRIELHSEPVVVGSITADDAGNGAADIVIPADTPAGDHQLVAIAGELTASTPLNVTAAAVEPSETASPSASATPTATAEPTGGPTGEPTTGPTSAPTDQPTSSAAPSEIVPTTGASAAPSTGGGSESAEPSVPASSVSGGESNLPETGPPSSLATLVLASLALIAAGLVVVSRKRGARQG